MWEKDIHIKKSINYTIKDLNIKNQVPGDFFCLICSKINEGTDFWKRIRHI